MSGQELRQAALLEKKVRSGVLFLALALPFPLSSKAEVRGCGYRSECGEKTEGGGR